MLSYSIHHGLACCDAHRDTAARCHLHLIWETTGDSVMEMGWRYLDKTLPSEIANSPSNKECDIFHTVLCFNCDQTFR